MERTKLMEQYEKETGREADSCVVYGSRPVYKYEEEYVAWLEAKLTPPFKPQVIANLLDLYIACDEDGVSCAYQSEPKIIIHKWNTAFNYLRLPDGLIDWGDTDWKDSLTIPEGWE